MSEKTHLPVLPHCRQSMQSATGPLPSQMISVSMPSSRRLSATMPSAVAVHPSCLGLLFTSITFMVSPPLFRVPRATGGAAQRRIRFARPVGGLASPGGRNARRVRLYRLVRNAAFCPPRPGPGRLCQTVAACLCAAFCRIHFGKIGRHGRLSGQARTAFLRIRGRGVLLPLPSGTLFQFYCTT